MDNQMEYLRQTAAETRGNTLESWEGCLIPGITNEDAFRLLEATPTAAKVETAKKNGKRPAPAKESVSATARA